MGPKRQIKWLLLLSISVLIILGIYNISDTVKPVQRFSAQKSIDDANFSENHEEKAEEEADYVSSTQNRTHDKFTLMVNRRFSENNDKSAIRRSHSAMVNNNTLISDNSNSILKNLTEDDHFNVAYEKLLKDRPRNLIIRVSDSNGDIIKSNIHPADVANIRNSKRHTLKYSNTFVHGRTNLMNAKDRYDYYKRFHLNRSADHIRDPRPWNEVTDLNRIKLEDRKWDRYYNKINSRASQKAISWDQDWLTQFAKKSLFNLMDITFIGKGIYPHKADSFKPAFSVNGTEFSVLNRRLYQELRRDSKSLPDDAVVYNLSDLPVELYNLAPYLLDKIPRQFLPNLKSQCWENNEVRRYYDASVLCLPYFYIIGAPKCATTDLWAKINLHPDVLPGKFKEPQFWTRGNLVHGLTSYCYHFHALVEAILNPAKGHNERLVSGDGTASNFWERRRSVMLYGTRPDGPPYFVADLIRAIQPSAKIIVILRNPTPRLYSEYLDLDAFWPLYKSPEDFHQRVENVIRHFNNCLVGNRVLSCASNYYQPRIQVGMYSVHLREWLRRFPRDQVMILRTEEWANNPEENLKKTYEFLELSPMSDVVLRGIVTLNRHNVRKKKNKKIGGMLPETKEMLDTFYRPFNEDLADLMDDEGYKWTS